MRSQRLLTLLAALVLMLPVGLLAQNTPAQDNQNMPNNGNMSNSAQQNSGRR